MKVKALYQFITAKHSPIILSHFIDGHKAFSLDKDDFSNFGKYVSAVEAESW